MPADRLREVATLVDLSSGRAKLENEPMEMDINLMKEAARWGGPILRG